MLVNELVLLKHEFGADLVVVALSLVVWGPHDRVDQDERQLLSIVSQSDALLLR